LLCPSGEILWKTVLGIRARRQASSSPGMQDSTSFDETGDTESEARGRAGDVNMSIGIHEVTL